MRKVYSRIIGIVSRVASRLKGAKAKDTLVEVHIEYNISRSVEAELGSLSFSEAKSLIEQQSSKRQSFKGGLKNASIEYGRKDGVAHGAGNEHRGVGKSHLVESIRESRDEELGTLRQQHTACETDIQNLNSERDAIKEGQRDDRIEVLTEQTRSGQHQNREKLQEELMHSRINRDKVRRRSIDATNEALTARDKHNGRKQYRSILHNDLVLYAALICVALADYIPLSEAIISADFGTINLDIYGKAIAAIYGGILAFAAHQFGEGWGHGDKTQWRAWLAVSCVMLGYAATWRPDAVLFTLIMIGTWSIAAALSFKRSYNIEAIEAEERAEKARDDFGEAELKLDQTQRKLDELPAKQQIDSTNAKTAVRETMLSQIKEKLTQVQKVKNTLSQALKNAEQSWSGIEKLSIAQYDKAREEGYSMQNGWRDYGRSSAASILVLFLFFLTACQQDLVITESFYLVGDTTAGNIKGESLDSNEVFGWMGIGSSEIENEITFASTQISDVSFPEPQPLCYLMPDEPWYSRSTLLRKGQIQDFRSCIRSTVDDMSEHSNGQPYSYVYRTLHAVLTDAAKTQGQVAVISDLVEHNPIVSFRKIESLASLDADEREELCRKLGPPLPDLTGVRVQLIFAGAAEDGTDETAYQAHGFFQKLLEGQGAEVSRHGSLPPATMVSIEPANAKIL